MALKATIYKAEVQVADMDRHYYGKHSLTVARHPSETDERMMVRLLAFALNAQDALAFGKGLAVEDEPDLWLRDLTGAIELWLDVGLPEEKRIRRACGRAKQVCIYCYGGNAAGIWWNQTGPDLKRHSNLSISNVPREASQAMAAFAQRNMKLQVTVQEGQIWVADAKESIQLELVPLKTSDPAGT